MMDLSGFDLGYLCGLIDGEGCIRMDRNKQSCNRRMGYRPSLTIAMCDPGPVEWFHQLVGGSKCIKRRRLAPAHHRDVYRVDVFREAILRPLLVLIAPLLKVKGEQARACLAFYEFRDKHRSRRNPGRNSYPLGYFIGAEAYYKHTMALNQRHHMPAPAPLDPVDAPQRAQLELWGAA